MIVIHASFPIDPDRRDDALELIEELVIESQREDGMIDYRRRPRTFPIRTSSAFSNSMKTKRRSAHTPNQTTSRSSPRRYRNCSPVSPR